MDRSALKRWRTTLAISFLVHIVILAGVGWVISKTHESVAIPEPLIELELGNEEDNFPETEPSDTKPVGEQLAMGAQQPHPALTAEPTLEQTTAAIGQMTVISSAGTDMAADNSSAMGGGSSEATGDAGNGRAGNGGSADGGRGTGVSVNPRKIIPPQILRSPKAPYPEAARQAGIEGTVILKIQILENGRSGQISVYKSSGSDLLDQAAVAAVTNWRFIPAKVRDTGQSIICSTTLPVVFKLQ